MEARAGEQRLACDRGPSHQLEMSFEHVVWPLLQLVQAPGQCLRIMVGATAKHARKHNMHEMEQQYCRHNKLSSCPFTGLRRVNSHGLLELERLLGLVDRGHVAGLELSLGHQHVRVDAAKHAGHDVVVVVALASLVCIRRAVVRLDVEALCDRRVAV